MLCVINHVSNIFVRADATNLHVYIKEVINLNVLAVLNNRVLIYKMDFKAVGKLGL